MRVKYFSDTATAIIGFTDKAVHETKEISQNIYIDIDATGNLISITVEHAKGSAGLWEFSYQDMPCETT